MIRTLLAAPLALSCVSCNLSSSGQHMDDHWSWRSIMPRANRYILGYDANQHGTYRDFQYERKQAIELDIRRHFFNHNPDNPNHPEVPSRFEPRPDHSLLPNPARYIHLEGLLLGAALIPATGGFFPLPVDSILGTADEGGWDEFMHNREEALAEDEVISASVPPSLGMEGEDVIVSTVTQQSK